MTDTAANAGGNQQQQPQGRSWKQTIFQILLFQMVMRFFAPKPQQQPLKDPVTGAIIPPLQNAFEHKTHYDLFFHISPNATSALIDLPHSEKDAFIWFLPNQIYEYDRKVKDRTTPETLSYLPSPELFQILTTQHLSQLDETNENDDQESEDNSNVLDRLSGLTKLRKKAERRKQWLSLYLIASAVPHSVYGDLASPKNMVEAIELLNNLNLPADEAEKIVRGSIDLIEYMEPIATEKGQNLLEGADTTNEEKSMLKQKIIDEPHWKDHLDVRVVYDQSPLTPQTIQSPHLKKYIHTQPERGVYHPILVPSDLWLLERNFIPLNSTLSNIPLNITLSYNTLNSMWWMIQSQLMELWDPQRGVHSDGPISPFMALQSHSRRETFMVKRIVLDTNPYVLGFSAIFMLLHSLFSFLAFKNDIQFWNKNESMQGLSALSIVFNFFCEVIIALYLYDSEETSLLILFEIFLGVALSAWKVTKAVNVSFKRQPGRWLPVLTVGDKKDYEESDTKKYDSMAIQYMSILLLPCCLGYSLYSLKTKKYKSWYSFVISSLAGTVYTFGFIMMTPQLYINYKLKSVDHLPWRAFTYKALNTFVDDIAAFIIDMPLMHRLACFRDGENISKTLLPIHIVVFFVDIIFVCYLYQRWIYYVDKTRPSEWTDPKEQERLLKEKEETQKQDKVENLETEMVTSDLRKRRKSSDNDDVTCNQPDERSSSSEGNKKED